MPNSKHQIPNKFQITILNDRHRPDQEIPGGLFFRLLKSSCFRDKGSFFLSEVMTKPDKVQFGILNFGHAQRRRLRRVLGFVCDLEYSTEIEAFFV
jgi:hypothetical protein